MAKTVMITNKAAALSAAPCGDRLRRLCCSMKARSVATCVANSERHSATMASLSLPLPPKPLPASVESPAPSSPCRREDEGQTNQRASCQIATLQTRFCVASCQLLCYGARLAKTVAT